MKAGIFNQRPSVLNLIQLSENCRSFVYSKPHILNENWKISHNCLEMSDESGSTIKAYFIGREVWIIERNSWVSTGIDRISLLF